MPFEFIQVPAHGGSSGKEELNRLLRSGRIVSVRKEFVAAGEDSFWAFCVEFLEGAVPVEKGRGVAKVDSREVLGEEEFLMFSKLRDWRRTMVEKEAVPAYAIFTNEQLAGMVTAKVGTLSALGLIAGIGQARVEKYGEAVLRVLTGKGGAA